MFKIVAQVALFAMLVLPGHAEGWVVNRVRGTADHLTGGKWIPLERGAMIDNGQSLKTGADGRVGLVRGAETVELEPGTQILLHEGAGKMTSFEQASGLMSVDVERRNVQHFSVQTPFLAAVVKGTKFTVSVGRNASHVSVDRGVVQVQDTLNDLVVDIVRGQEAEVSQAAPLTVTGTGSVAVFNFEGQRVVNGTADMPADNKGNALETGSSERGGAGGNNVKAPGNDSQGNNGTGSSGQNNGNSGGQGNGSNGNGNGASSESTGNNGNGKSGKND